MSRCYDVIFRVPGVLDELRIRTYRNTGNAAVTSARGTLRRDHSWVADGAILLRVEHVSKVDR